MQEKTFKSTFALMGFFLIAVICAHPVLAARQGSNPSGRDLEINEVQVKNEGDAKVLYIYGKNFDNGYAPVLTLGPFTPTVTSVSDEEIVAQLAENELAGDYRLTITTGASAHGFASYDLTIGSDESQGEPGSDCVDVIFELCDIYKHLNSNNDPSSLKWPVICWNCGNGTIEPLEECDDGNQTNDDGCSANCKLEIECYEGDTQFCGINIGACEYGIQICGHDNTWGPCEGEIGPEEEICNDQVDNDCDGSTDEGCPVDNDWDGYSEDIDCNDYDSNVYPGATEYCDGIDNDCDGEIDENCPGIAEP